MKKDLKKNDDLSTVLQRRIETELLLDDSSEQIIIEFTKSFLSRDYYTDENGRLKKVWTKSREHSASNRIYCSWGYLTKTFFEENPDYGDKSKVNLFRNLKRIIESAGHYACGKDGKNVLFYYEKIQEGVVSND